MIRKRILNLKLFLSELLDKETVIQVQAFIHN